MALLGSEKKADEPAPSSRSPDSYRRLATPVLRSAWLLFGTAIVSLIATVLGTIVAPGIRGNGSQTVVTRWELLASIFSYAMGMMLIGLIATAAYDLARSAKPQEDVPRVVVITRFALIGGAVMVTGMVIPAFVRNIPPPATAVLVFSTCFVAVVGAISGLRAPHTRVVALVLIIFALAALIRLGAWQTANAAAENARTYSIARGLATASVALEGLGQLVAVVWLATRGHWTSQLLSSLALAGAFVVVWGADRGRHENAATWEAVLNTALGSPQAPVPYALASVGAFFGVASMFLALVALLQRSQVLAITTTLALALIARSAFDAPLRGLAACAAAMWLSLTTMDDRELWKALVLARGEKK